MPRSELWTQMPNTAGGGNLRLQGKPKKRVSTSCVKEGKASRSENIRGCPVRRKLRSKVGHRRLVRPPGKSKRGHVSEGKKKKRGLNFGPDFKGVNV